MEPRRKTVLGASAPGVRLTPLGAALLMMALALPVGPVVAIVAWVL